MVALLPPRMHSHVRFTGGQYSGPSDAPSRAATSRRLIREFAFQPPVGTLENGASGGKRLGQQAAHASELRALAWKKKGSFHQAVQGIQRAPRTDRTVNSR